MEVFEKENWTHKEILSRGVKIYDFIKERWELSFADDLASKKKILRLANVPPIADINDDNFEEF